MSNMDVLKAAKSEWSFDGFGVRIISHYSFSGQEQACKYLKISELELNNKLFTIVCVYQDVKSDQTAAKLLTTIRTEN